MNSIGERLLSERERIGLSQTELADVCGITMRSQRNYEKDERTPDAVYLLAAAAAGIDVQYVLFGTPLEPQHRDVYQRTAQASLKAADPALAKSYIGSLPKVHAHKLMIGERERKLLSAFRTLENDDQEAVLRTVNTMAGGKNRQRI